MNDQQWEQFIEKARRDDQALKPPPQQANARFYALWAFVSPICLFVAFFLPPNWAELLLFLVCILGGLFSFGMLAAYACTDRVSHQTKEAALSFLLGNLLVLFVLMLNPV